MNKPVVTGLLQDCAVLTRVSNLAWPAWVHRSNAGVMSPSGMTPCRGGDTHLRASSAPEVWWEGFVVEEKIPWLVLMLKDCQVYENTFLEPTPLVMLVLVQTPRLPVQGAIRA